MADALPIDVIITAGQQIVALKTTAVATIWLVCYDYWLTLGDEVKYIWREKFTHVTAIYLFIRYYGTLAILVFLVGVVTPVFSTETCRTFALFEPFGITLPLLAASNSLMTMRVYALYGRSKIVLAFFISLLTIQLAVGFWIYGKDGRTILEFPFPVGPAEPFHVCLNLPDPKLGIRSAIYLFLEAIFDSSVFLLTSYKTIRAVLERREGIINTLARHGLIYYSVIVSSCLVWALMVIFAAPGLQYINAIPTDCISLIIVCRITISLRAQARGQGTTEMFAGVSVSDNKTDSTMVGSNPPTFGKVKLHHLQAASFGTATRTLGDHEGFELNIVKGEGDGGR